MNYVPDINYKKLAYDIVYQAIRDFIKAKNDAKERATIIKQLRSPYMDFISDGLSLTLADKLETHPREVCNRVKQMDHEEEKRLSKEEAKC